MTIEVEASFDGQPQDIEWLHADGALVLVQSRPITGLPPPPLKDVRWEPPDPGAISAAPSLWSTSRTR